MSTTSPSFAVGALLGALEGIQAAQATLDAGANQVLAARGLVGIRTNRLDGVKDGLTQYKLDVQSLLSNLEDADVTKAAADLSMQQVALQAAAEAASRVFQTSLLNFLPVR